MLGINRDTSEVPGPGVFIEEIKRLFQERGLATLPIFAVRRTLPGETGAGVLREYEALLEQLARSDPEFRYEIVGPTLEAGPLDTATSSDIVQCVLGACRRVFGEEIGVAALDGATDAQNFGFPTVIFGPGTLLQAHSLNEYVNVRDLAAATRVYLWSTLDLLATAHVARS